MLILNLLGVFLGLATLLFSGDKFVKYSVFLADLLGVAKLFLGFVLMAIGTGLPELALTIAGIFSRNYGVASGAIIGSNLSDVSLILGLPAVIFGTLSVAKKEKIPLITMLLVTSIVMGLIFIAGNLTPLHGVGLILIYFATVWWLWTHRFTKVVHVKAAVKSLRRNGTRHRASFYIILSLTLKMISCLVIVLVASKISIDSAAALSNYFSVSSEFIGVTIFAVGTSLPELVISLMSVKNKEYSLAFGCSFGSVLEQATLILGILAIGSKDGVNVSSLRSIAPFMFLSYLIVANGLLKKPKAGSQNGLSRTAGAALIFLFVCYLVSAVYAHKNG